jgi:hypothetical protein
MERPTVAGRRSAAGPLGRAKRKKGLRAKIEEEVFFQYFFFSEAILE